MTTGTRGLVAAVGASLLGHVVPTVVLRPVARGLRGRVHPRVEAYVRSRKKNLLKYATDLLTAGQTSKSQISHLSSHTRPGRSFDDGG